MTTRCPDKTDAELLSEAQTVYFLLFRVYDYLDKRFKYTACKVVRQAQRDVGDYIEALNRRIFLRRLLSRLRPGSKPDHITLPTLIHAQPIPMGRYAYAFTSSERSSEASINAIKTSFARATLRAQAAEGLGKLAEEEHLKRTPRSSRNRRPPRGSMKRILND